MELAPGIRIGPYELVAPLGAGGMGEVWRARDPRLGREVAIKLLGAGMLADRDARRRFEREARAAAALSHPAILAIFDVGEHAERPYLVTELLRGESLRERLRGGPLDPREVVEIGGDLAVALVVAHRAGIVHRDLKPENVFLTEDGQTKILDFGLALLTERQERTTELHTRTGMVVGTVGYISPEQLRGEKAGPAADLFALGCLLYESLAGAPAFHGESVAATLSAVLHREPRPLPELRPEVSAALAGIVLRCLQKEPEKRPSAAELQRGLGGLALSGPTLVLPLEPAPVAAGRHHGKRREIAVAAAAAALLVLIVALGWRLTRRPAARPPQAPAPMAAAGGPDGALPTKQDRGTSDEAAWRLYLRARYDWEKRTGPALLEAKDLYRSAVEKDPTFARAWLGLADTYAILNDYTAEPAAETFPKAKAAALRALEVDPDLAGAHTDLAYVALYFDRDWAEAEGRFRRALELDPKSPKARQWYAELLCSQGRFDAALEQVREAQGLDPLAPMMVADEVWFDVAAGRFEDAVARARDSGPDFSRFGPLRAYEALALVRLGRAAEADRILSELEAGKVSPVISLWRAHALAVAGERGAARAKLQDALDTFGDRNLIAYYRAYPLLDLGRTDEALEALRTAVRRHEGQVIWMRFDPNLEALRSDSRFAALLRDAGFIG